MRPLFDINVLLDLFLNRAPWVADAIALWQANRAGRIAGCVAAFTLPTLYYVMGKQVGTAAALAAVRDCLNELEVIPVGRTTLEEAYRLSGVDFEDSLQLACAIEAGTDAIVTRDPAGFAGAPVPVLSPADLVARLQAGSP
jgi:predicted nucleic acid-binding protein